MDITPQDNTQPISDDQELAKALAGVLPEDDSTTDKNSPTSLQADDTSKTADASASPAPADGTAPATPGVPADDKTQQTPPDLPTADVPEFTMPSLDMPTATDTSNDGGVLGSTASPELDNIKLDALKELRPLMDKVDLPAEEKFNTYLMLVRSTDDQSLIAPLHSAAQGIGDEKKKAEALLEIIKEIDYLSRKDKPAK